MTAARADEVRALGARTVPIGRPLPNVRAAVLDVNGAQEQVDAANSRLRLAEQELSDARERFQSGVAGTADVVTASLRLNDARTAYTDALVAYQTARVALATAEGNVTELP